jgi:hypothetical protein
MDKNAYLDLIELLDQERRRNEAMALSSQDAADRDRLAAVARRDAAAISDLRRKLAPTPRTRRRLPTGKREFDAYLDSLLDTCFEATRAEPTRGLRDIGRPRTRGR